MQEPSWSGLLEVGGHRVAVDVRGDQPSLLLINGVGGGHRIWEPLRAALPPGLGTLAFDAPGWQRGEFGGPHR